MPQAKDALRATAQYIRLTFGQRARNEFMSEVRHTSQLLGTNPRLGKAEPLLAERTIMYRSIVVQRLNKIVYSIQDDHVEVVDFWDVRREPKALSEEVK